jgi:hypothetical protein
MIPTLEAYVSGLRWIILVLAGALVGGFIVYELRKHRRRRASGSQPQLGRKPGQSRFQPASNPLPPTSGAGQPQVAAARTPPEQNQPQPQDTSQEHPVPVESKA